MRAIGRWLVRGLFGLALLVFMAVATLAVAGHTRPGRDFLRAQILSLLAASTTAEIRVGDVGGTLGHTLVLDDVRVLVDGHVVAALPRIGIAYRLLPLLGGRLDVDELRLDAPRIRAVHTAGGWRLPALRGGGGGTTTTVLHRIAVDDGRIAVALLGDRTSRRFAATALHLRATARLGDDGETVRVSSLRAVPRGVALGVVEATLAVARSAAGDLDVQGFSLTTPRSRVRAAGRLDRERAVALAARLAPLAAADVRALLPDVALRSDVRLHLRADGPWRAIAVALHGRLAPRARLAARGTLDAATEPRAIDVALRFAHLDPGSVLATLPPADASGSVAATGALAARGPLDWHAELRPSTVAGRRLDRLAIDGRSAGDVHRVHGRVRAPLGDAAVHARLALGRVPAYRLDGRFTLARLDLLAPSTWGWAVGRAEVRGEGVAADARHASASVELTSASVHGVPIDAASAQLRLDGSVLGIPAARVVGPELHATVAGTVPFDAHAIGQLAIEAGADLGGLGARLGRPLAGRAALHADARGRRDALDVRATGTITDFASGALAAGTVTLASTLRGVGGESGTGDLTVDASALRLGTRKPYPLHGTAAWRRSAGVDHVDVHVLARSDAGAVQEVALVVTREASVVRGRLDRLTLTPVEGPPWRLAEPATFELDDTLAVQLALAAGEQRLAIAGRLARGDGTNDARVHVERIALAPLCAIAGMPACDGAVDGDASIRGTAAAPVLDLRATAAELHVERVAYGTLALDVRYAERAARVDATLHHPTAGDVTATGRIPVDLAWSGARTDLSGVALDLAVRADGLDLTILTVLAAGQVREAAGRLDADVHVGGTRAAPDVRGALTIADARLLLAPAGVAYEHVRLEMRAAGPRIALTVLHAETGPGRLDGTGTFVVQPGAETQVDLSLELREFHAVEQQAYAAVVSGRITASGTSAAPVVRGTLDVDHATVRPARLPASGPALAPDPTIDVVGEPASAPEPQGPGLPERVALDVTVHVARDAWIHRADTDIELAGDLHLLKAAGESVHVVGRIRLVRGWYAFQGRRFTLEPDGAVTFTGATPPDPVIDVTAIYRSGEYEVQVHVSGPLSKPHLDLTSNPPLEQADILAVLLFGRPTNELGRSQSAGLRQQALSLAAGYVMPELRTSVMNTLGLDTLEVAMPEGTTEPGQVRVGRYVAQDVFLSVAQEFGNRTAEVVGVEYYLTPRISVRGSTSTRGDSALDVLWHYLY